MSRKKQNAGVEVIMVRQMLKNYFIKSSALDTLSKSHLRLFCTIMICR